jgi:hypothetical protein
MPSPQQPTAHSPHKRVTKATEDDEEDPHIALVNQHGCGKVYTALEDCLADGDRDWSKCQHAVQALKQCHSKATGIVYK